MADWSDLIGKTLEEGIRIAARYQHKLRVIRWNDTPAVVTRDYVGDRINVYVTRNPTTVEGAWRIVKVVGNG